MRFKGWTLCVALLSYVVSPAWSQEATDVPLELPASNPQVTPQAAPKTQDVVIQVPVIAFDRDRIFAESDIGRDLERQIEISLDALLAENDVIFAALEAEEKELTTLKDTLASDEFTQKADVFDAKVIAKRAEQKAKSEAIQLIKDQGVREFEQKLNVVLKDIAQEVRAVAVFERAQIYLMSGSIDISLEVVKRLNANFAEVSQEPPTGQGAVPVPIEQ